MCACARGGLAESRARRRTLDVKKLHDLARVIGRTIAELSHVTIGAVIQINHRDPFGRALREHASAVGHSPPPRRATKRHGRAARL